ncbi:MAG: hypothetical protein PF689_12960 [Deltaproteobacteria bacterium]|jgi:glyceraldehyde-3-phosphate dehydrogenase/erythrose-4-phosphate dehydrogenase|nr:hypothetical protein [Deltaproteobacteria bacterium]
MNKHDLALWGCGKIGQATGKIIRQKNLELKWVYDKNIAKAAIFQRNYEQGELLHKPPDAASFPKVKTVIDASGDENLLAYWTKVLQFKRVKHIILTRREPRADNHYMAGLYSQKPFFKKGSITSMGSCTGNCLIPLISHLETSFAPAAISCRILHPLKQDKIFTLRNIKTALKLSLQDHLPHLTDIFIGQSMELPTKRGMALDLAINFKNPVKKNELTDFFENLSDNYEFFHKSRQSVDSDLVINRPESAILDINWKFTNNHFRGLIWQDNEYGFSSRIYDLMQYLE